MYNIIDITDDIIEDDTKVDTDSPYSAENENDLEKLLITPLASMSNGLMQGPIRLVYQYTGLGFTDIALNDTLAMYKMEFPVRVVALDSTWAVCRLHSRERLGDDNISQSLQSRLYGHDGLSGAQGWASMTFTLQDDPSRRYVVLKRNSIMFRAVLSTSMPCIEDISKEDGPCTPLRKWQAEAEDVEYALSPVLESIWLNHRRLLTREWMYSSCAHEFHVHQSPLRGAIQADDRNEVLYLCATHPYQWVRAVTKQTSDPWSCIVETEAGQIEHCCVASPRIAPLDSKTDLIHLAHRITECINQEDWHQHQAHIPAPNEMYMENCAKRTVVCTFWTWVVLAVPSLLLVVYASFVLADFDATDKACTTWWDTRQSCVDDMHVCTYSTLSMRCSVRPTVHHLMTILGLSMLLISYILIGTIFRSCRPSRNREFDPCHAFMLTLLLTFTTVAHLLFLIAFVIDTKNDYVVGTVFGTVWMACSLVCDCCVHISTCFAHSYLTHVTTRRSLRSSPMDASSLEAIDRRRRRRLRCCSRFWQHLELVSS